MSTNDGGPAFPITEFRLLNAAGEARINEDYPDEREKAYIATRNRAAMGMSLRDWFAGCALKGLLAKAYFVDDDNIEISPQEGVEYAETAYELADAMLKARQT